MDILPNSLRAFVVTSSILLACTPAFSQNNSSVDSLARTAHRNYARIGVAFEPNRPYAFASIEYFFRIGPKRRYFVGPKFLINAKKKSNDVGNHDDVTSSDISIAQQFYFKPDRKVTSFISISTGVRFLKQEVRDVYWTTVPLFGIPIKQTDVIYEKEQRSPSIGVGYGFHYRTRDKIGISPAFTVFYNDAFEEYNEKPREKMFLNLSLCVQVNASR